MRDEFGRSLGMPETWLPLLYFQDEYFFVVLDERELPALPVLHRLAEDTDQIVFLSLESMIRTFLEAADAEAWHPDDGTVWNGETFEGIRSRRNPGTEAPWS